MAMSSTLGLKKKAVAVAPRQTFSLSSDKVADLSGWPTTSNSIIIVGVGNPLFLSILRYRKTSSLMRASMRGTSRSVSKSFLTALGL